MMVTLTFKLADGGERTVDAAVGDSVMEIARANGIDEIAAECGGEMMCATCHAYVDDAWAGTVGAASEDEQDMLDFASSEVRPTSRLSCQIRMTAELDGLVLHLPESQV